MLAVQEFLNKGGIFIYPILLFSFWAFVLIIERAIYYFQVASQTTKMVDRFFESLEGGGIPEARDFLKGQSGLLKSVLAAALENASLPVLKIEKKVEAVLLNQLPALNRFLNLIATLGTLMPMLGLLGTVTGMIATFKVIALQGTGDAQAMADGISEALITTQAGLVAAIPIILFHTFLINRTAKIVDVVKASVTRLIDMLDDVREGAA
jgi:biopolymer transport protein ExbB